MISSDYWPDCGKNRTSVASFTKNSTDCPITIFFFRLNVVVDRKRHSTEWFLTNEVHRVPVSEQYYSESIDKLRMMPWSRQRIPESFEICQLTATKETSYNSVVWAMDTGVIRSLPIDSDRKN